MELTREDYLSLIHEEITKISSTMRFLASSLSLALERNKELEKEIKKIKRKLKLELSTIKEHMKEADQG